MNTDKRILEVIACSVEDAVEAERGGATRLEVISRFDLGGLTPSLALVRDIRARLRLPVRVMLRESEGFEVADASERHRLCNLAGELAEIGVEGLVLGFLRAGAIDTELVGRVLMQAPNVRATFHRAFEEVREPFAAIEALKRFPQIDCILTSGGSGDWADRAKFLTMLQGSAAPELTVLVGGGVDLHSFEFLLHSTSIRAFHLGRAARLPVAASGAVRASQVRGFARRLQWKS